MILLSNTKGSSVRTMERKTCDALPNAGWMFPECISFLSGVRAANMIKDMNKITDIAVKTMWQSVMTLPHPYGVILITLIVQFHFYKVKLLLTIVLPEFQAVIR